LIDGSRSLVARPVVDVSGERKLAVEMSVVSFVR
jgi:hypothetical protein